MKLIRMSTDISKTIPENIFRAASAYPSKKALLYKRGGAYFAITYGELEAKAKTFASFLSVAGVKAGDKVAILARNSTQWAIADLGAMTAGAISVPAHATLSPKIINYILNHSEAKILLVYGLDSLNKVLLFQNDLPDLQKIIFVGEAGEEQKEISQKEIISWDEAMAIGERSAFTPAAGDSESVASIIYTSGTTGLPKGAMLTHRNFLANADAVLRAVPVNSSDIFLSFLPLSHVLERLAGYYAPLLCGATIAYAEGIKQLKDNLKEVKPTILICVPRIFEKFYDAVWDSVRAGSALKRRLFLWALKQEAGSWRRSLADKLVFKKVRQAFGGRLRLTVSGGASLDEKTARFFAKIGVAVLEGYGLTETSPVLAVNREGRINFGSVGEALDNVVLKIAEDKEILARGPNVMKGYYKHQAGADEAIDNEGWFHTGDLGFLDDDGFLTIIGRKKEMMVTSGGKNIWPEVLEQAIVRDRFVAQAMVVGHNRKFVSALVAPDWEEVGIYLKENHLPMRDQSDLIKDEKIIGLFQERMEKINEDLADYERIRAFRLLSAEWSQEKDELTPTLKLRRSAIETKYRKEIENMYV